MATTIADKIRELRKRTEKHYKDSTELFPDFTTIKKIEVIPTSSVIINAVAGVGGVPRGRLTEIYGPESTGKTTIAIEACIAAQQSRGNTGIAGFCDFEHAFDASYAHKLGLNLDPSRFIFLQPDYGEQGFAILDELITEDLIDIGVIDSAAAATPRSEIEGDVDKDGGSQKGAQSAMMAQFLARVTKKINKGRKPALFITNQTRAVINIGGRPAPNAPKEDAAGGKALRFYGSIRLMLELIKKEGDEGRGTKGTDQVYKQNRIRITCVKNKLAPPWMRGEFNMEFGKGIDNITSIADLAEAKLGIMSGAGFFKYNGKTPATSISCRGREAFQEHLKTNPALLRELESSVLSHIREEHAKQLGLTKLTTSEPAKEIEDTPGTLVLSSGTSTQKDTLAPGIEFEDE